MKTIKSKYDSKPYHIFGDDMILSYNVNSEKSVSVAKRKELQNEFTKIHRKEMNELNNQLAYARSAAIKYAIMEKDFYKLMDNFFKERRIGFVDYSYVSALAMDRTNSNTADIEISYSFIELRERWLEAKDRNIKKEKHA